MIELRINSMAVYDTAPELRVAFGVPRSEAVNDLYKLKDKSLDGYTLTLRKRREKSTNANSYLWQLCTKIATRIRVTKEDVYRKAVREAGVYTEGVFEHEYVDEIVRTWERNGIGWFAEKYHSTENVAVMRLYKGSSVYDGEQMRELIDYVVDEAQNLGIETMTPGELERLKQLWETTGT